MIDVGRREDECRSKCLQDVNENRRLHHTAVRGPRTPSRRAHVAELPNKIGLARHDDLTVQQIYRGWALFGIVVVGALASTLTLTIMSRRRASRALPFALAVLISLIVT